MNRFLLLFTLAAFLITCQNEPMTKSYEGIITDGQNERATFEVLQSVKNDSVIWSYRIFHGDDSTIYTVEYQNNSPLKELTWHDNIYSVSDTISCHEDVVYVFDVLFHDSKGIEGFFFVSTDFGMLSVGDFNRADYFEFTNHPKFEPCLKSYVQGRIDEKTSP